MGEEAKNELIKMGKDAVPEIVRVLNASSEPGEPGTLIYVLILMDLDRSTIEPIFSDQIQKINRVSNTINFASKRAQPMIAELIKKDASDVVMKGYEGFELTMKHQVVLSASMAGQKGVPVMAEVIKYPYQGGNYSFTTMVEDALLKLVPHSVPLIRQMLNEKPEFVTQPGSRWTNVRGSSANPNLRVAIHATKAIKPLPDDMLKRLVEIAGDENMIPNSRTAAIERIASEGKVKENAALFTKAIQDEDEDVRQAASSAYTEFLKESPQNGSRELNTAGYRAYQNGDFKAALDLFTKASDLDPSYALARYNKLCATFKLRNCASPQKAVAELKQIVKLDPKRIEKIKTDPDLKPLHNYAPFYFLIGYSVDNPEEEKAIIMKCRWFGPVSGELGHLTELDLKADGKFTFRYLDFSDAESPKKTASGVFSITKNTVQLHFDSAFKGRRQYNGSLATDGMLKFEENVGAFGYEPPCER